MTLKTENILGSLEPLKRLPQSQGDIHYAVKCQVLNVAADTLYPSAGKLVHDGDLKCGREMDHTIHRVVVSDILGLDETAVATDPILRERVLDVGTGSEVRRPYRASQALVFDTNGKPLVGGNLSSLRVPTSEEYGLQAPAMSAVQQVPAAGATVKDSPKTKSLEPQLPEHLRCMLSWSGSLTSDQRRAVTDLLMKYQDAFIDPDRKIIGEQEFQSATSVAGIMSIARGKNVSSEI